MIRPNFGPNAWRADPVHEYLTCDYPGTETGLTHYDFSATTVTVIPLNLRGPLALVRARYWPILGSAGTGTWSIGFYRAVAPLIKNKQAPVSIQNAPELTLIPWERNVFTTTDTAADAPVTVTGRELLLDPAQGQYYVGVQVSDPTRCQMRGIPSRFSLPFTALATHHAPAPVSPLFPMGDLPQRARIQITAPSCPLIALRSALGIYYYGDPEVDWT